VEEMSISAAFAKAETHPGISKKDASKRMQASSQSTFLYGNLEMSPKPEVL
jgi:hypothetical protein